MGTLNPTHIATFLLKNYFAKKILSEIQSDRRFISMPCLIAMRSFPCPSFFWGYQLIISVPSISGVSEKHTNKNSRTTAVRQKHSNISLDNIYYSPKQLFYFAKKFSQRAIPVFNLITFRTDYIIIFNRFTNLISSIGGFIHYIAFVVF